MIHITVDRRENGGVADKLRELGAEVTLSQIEIGDFVLSDRVVCERKTRADFEGSIVDGRLFRQLKILSEAYPCAIVVVEGRKEEQTRLPRAALLGAYASIFVDFGASLFFTPDAEGTAEVLFAIAKYEQEGKKVALPVFVKRKALTMEENQRAVIESLPKVGPKLAKALLERFGSVRGVADASFEELCKVSGLGEKRAKMIRNVFEAGYGGKT